MSDELDDAIRRYPVNEHSEAVSQIVDEILLPPILKVILELGERVQTLRASGDIPSQAWELTALHYALSAIRGVCEGLSELVPREIKPAAQGGAEIHRELGERTAQLWREDILAQRPWRFERRPE